MTGTRVASQHLLIMGRRLVEALAPFLDPAFRTSQTPGYLSRLGQVYPKKDYQRKDLRNKTSPLIHRSLGDEVEETRVMMTENSTPLSPICSLFLAPSGKLSQKLQDLLTEDEQAQRSTPPMIQHRVVAHLSRMARSRLER